MRAIGDKLAGANACDTEMDYFVGGRYIDRFEKRAGKWKITHRTGMTDWTRLEPPSSQGFGAIAEPQIGKRGKKDSSTAAASSMVESRDCRMPDT